MDAYARIQRNSKTTKHDRRRLKTNSLTNHWAQTQLLSVCLTTMILCSVGGCNWSELSNIPKQNESGSEKPVSTPLNPEAPAGEGENAVGNNSQPSPVASQGTLEDGEPVSVEQQTATPSDSAPANPPDTEAETVRLPDAPYSRIAAIKSDDPSQLIEHLGRVDEAIQSLLNASNQKMLGEEQFRAAGMRLGQIKLITAEQIIDSAPTDSEQWKTGKLTKLVALSHLSGFRSVEAAKDLEAYAREMSGSSDLDLAHQSRVVLFGFELQALQNGLSETPDALMEQAKQLFQRSEDANFPELMTLLQTNSVLKSMGFDEEAKQIDDLLVKTYSNSADPKLRSEAWNVSTRNSLELDNYISATQTLSADEASQQSAFAAARALYDAFPSALTLEQLASTITNLEYAGNVGFTRRLADFIESKLTNTGGTLPEGLAEGIQTIVGAHRLRTGLVGSKLDLSPDLVTFEGQPFDIKVFEGKVVLIDFWATWCGPCLREIPNIRSTYDALHSQGFEVLSINMDEKLEAAENFLRSRSFPWTTYRSADTTQLGFQSPFAKRLGISAIPFMVLVDQQGVVREVHVRGPRISQQVRGLLGLETSLIPDE